MNQLSGPTLPDVPAIDEAPATALFARILVPLDFSQACHKAVVTAYDIARRYGSEIHLFNLASFGQNSEYLAGLGAPRSRDDVRKDACQHMREYVETVVPGAPAFASCDVAMGDDLVEAIASAAEKTRATCIVLAIHQHPRRPLFRTRAEKILHAVSCPVLLVKVPEEPVVYYD